ncbi:MAG: DUF2076 domain-containing protein [Thiocapsa sp.]|nr:DUF2076 domain-containing protein [Thiocapsa sp.]MCG6897472.1 DUF2076 domain-containing protein [Thiocapsa sp.]
MAQAKRVRRDEQIIDALFAKLRQAEHQTGPRDQTAEEQIAAAIQRQPAAPYYMAQAILVQESALEKLGQRVRELEQQLANPPSGGGFLDSLFGASAAGEASSRPPQSTGPAMTKPRGPADQAAGGFLGSALQTAVAVAGGVMMANLLTGLFADEETQAAEAPAGDAGLDAEHDAQMMDDGDLGDFDGFDDF